MEKSDLSGAPFRVGRITDGVRIGKVVCVDLTFGNAALAAERFGMEAIRIDKPPEPEEGLSALVGSGIPLLMDGMTGSGLAVLPLIYFGGSWVKRMAK